MSSNEEINHLWAQHMAQKKEQERSVHQHNDEASAHSSSLRTIKGNELHTLKLEGDRNPQFVKDIASHGQIVTLEHLFSPESPVKAPLLGGGQTEVTTDGDFSQQPGVAGSLVSSSVGGKRQHKGRLTLLEVFQQWQEVKQILWDVVIARYNVHEFGFISTMFVTELDKTAKTVIDSNRLFCWEELELVMNQFLQHLFNLVEDHLHKMLGYQNNPEKTEIS